MVSDKYGKIEPVIKNIQVEETAVLAHKRQLTVQEERERILKQPDRHPGRALMGILGVLLILGPIVFSIASRF